MDDHGYKFQRITPTAISAIRPEVPTVTMAPLTRGYYDNPVTLTCGVDSLVPFEVRWFKDSTPRGNTLYYRCSKHPGCRPTVYDIWFYVKMYSYISNSTDNLRYFLFLVVEKSACLSAYYFDLRS